MEINRALAVINEKCGNFSCLPENMCSIINKAQLQKFLLETQKIEKKEIETFLNLIYDENEEDQENISYNNFIDKYSNLLKLLQDDEIEDNDNQNENNLKTPKKDSIPNDNIELGSPIINDNIFNKNEDDTIDPNELFKEMNFKKNKFKKNPDYISIVRPSNNFNFGSLNEFTSEKNPEKQQSPRPNIDGLESPAPERLKNANLPAIELDLDKKIYKTNKIDLLKYYDMKFLANKEAKNSKNLSIKQKLQDVFFQLHKPNDISQYNVYPSKLNFHSTPNNINLNLGVGSNNYYNNMPINLFNGSPRKRDDYFSDVYKMMNPYSSKSSVKSVTDKIYKIMKRDKGKDFFSFSSKKNKNSKPNLITQKLEGLNQMLNAKGDAFGDYNEGNNEKILNDDDFITLEDKMKQFELRKMKINHPEKKIIIDDLDFGFDNENNNNIMSEDDQVNIDIEDDIKVENAKEN